jgi:D-beta-D-heptose 7-phosphate kinase/D-beta-D-heptose 1-phosphate adenosyltransferase
MKQLIKKFSNTGILIIGDFMIDRYIWGTVDRISPEAPVPVVEVSKESLLLGGAANVAHNILSLGGKVFLAGVIGLDEAGESLKHLMEEKGINTRGIFEEMNRPTTVKTRIYAHDQQVVRYDTEMKSDIGRTVQSKLLVYVQSCLSEIKAIILSDYCKGVITKNFVRKLIELTGSKIFISVDPKIGHFDYYKGVTLVTPNINEASFGSGINITDDTTLARAGKVLLKKLQSRAVLITRGDKGMMLFERNGKITNIPTIAREVYDVTGAGDTVIAVMTLCHSAGAKLSDAAVIANHAAGIVVGKHGSAVVTAKDISECFTMKKFKLQKN